jgi:hypothetical protein
MVGLGDVVNEPPGEEGGERKFREDDQVAPCGGALAEQCDEACDDRRSVI